MAMGTCSIQFNIIYRHIKNYLDFNLLLTYYPQILLGDTLSPNKTVYLVCSLFFCTFSYVKTEV